MTESSGKIKYLVADTTAFINMVQLHDYAENILTVPDVIAEVRNKRQIRRLCVIPFDLQVREPRTESVKYCVEFAKKTGDYASLSGIDIKVIALTYELEVDNVGTEHLRKDPVKSEVIVSKEKPQELQDNTKLAGWYNPKGGADNEELDEESENEFDEALSENEEKSNESTEKAGQCEGIELKNVDTVKEAIEQQLGVVDDSNNTSCKDQDEITEEELEILFEKLKCEPQDDDTTCDILVPQSDVIDEKTDCADSDEDVIPDDNQNDEQSPTLLANDNEDFGDWITPSNIKRVKKSLEGKVDTDIVPIVACMSTDFALQNVLKQINLNICALNGRVIKHLRTYILRCYACFKTTSIMTKVFCPNCGNKTLKRVAVSLDENGKQVIHVNTRRPLTTKFKNQSLPRFQGGKHSRNPILFEDQPIPRQMPSRVAKTKTNALEEDYIAGYSPFVLRDVDSKSAMLRSKGNLKEWARNNTFEEDRRKKHYNRLYK